MKNKPEQSNKAKEAQYELKYCERCGGLWLRPVGGGQIYCAGCGREMAKLPPAYQAGETGIGRDAQWDGDDEEFDGYEGEGLDLNATGGVA